MTKRVMWKKFFGLEKTKVDISRKSTSWGFWLELENVGSNNYFGLVAWKGWTKKEALAQVKVLQAAGFDAEHYETWSNPKNGYTHTIFTVREDEKTVALNKLTAEECKLLKLQTYEEMKDDLVCGND